MKISKAAIRPLVEPRGEKALALANAMIEQAKAATAKEALEVHLVDFVVDNVDDLLESLDGMTVPDCFWFLIRHNIRRSPLVKRAVL